MSRCRPLTESPYATSSAHFCKVPVGKRMGWRGPERIRTSFLTLWNAFLHGPPPHAGIAPGFDRILMVLEEQVNIREVIAFPLKQSARDLRMGTPGPVSDVQLRDVHLKVVPPVLELAGLSRGDRPWRDGGGHPGRVGRRDRRGLGLLAAHRPYFEFGSPAQPGV